MLEDPAARIGRLQLTRRQLLHSAGVIALAVSYEIVVNLKTARS